MATIRKITRSNPVSNFQQTAPDGGGSFRLLAEGLNEIYKRVEPVAIDQMKKRGQDLGRDLAREQVGSNKVSVSSKGSATELIKGFEGFRNGTYWDVNAHRTGFGSDTITDKNGNVRKVKEGDTVTREDAERDLDRRVSTEFTPIAKKAVGADRFNSMSESQRASIVSIAYNYGKIPKRIVGALRDGSDEDAAQAIMSLGGDNDGVNRGRREKEAQVFLNGGITKSSKEPEVMVRTSEGKLESRLFSPYSGPILQAHNIAAGIAYQSEIMEQGAIDLMEISNQFEIDPEGFTQAATEYVSSIVKGAPENFRRDIRDVLETEVNRRRMGIMGDKQSDIRKRANNSSSALVDRWSNTYAEALASGNTEEIEASRKQLDNILQAREALPGIAWTTEQSANVLIKARKAGEKLQASARSEFAKKTENTFNLIIDAAKAGRTAVGEEILNNPEAIASNPELANEAQSFVTLRDNLPEFMKMTPAQQQAALAEIEKLPVSEDFQLDIAKAARDAAKENAIAWEKDPIKRASEVLDVPPPALPSFTTENEQDFIDALTELRIYGNRLVEEGFIQTPSFLTEKQSESLAEATGKGTPPEIRAAISSAIVAGFGNDAIRVFDEIDADKVTMFSGKMMALGGNPALATEMLRGQQMLDEGHITIPPKSDRIDAFNTEVAEAMRGIPNALKAQTELMTATQAIYAARAQGVDPKSDAAKELMSQSVQAALGQKKNKRGELTGGVQSIMGHPTLLPVGVPGIKAEQSVRLALGGLPHDNSLLGGFGNLGALVSGVGIGINPDAFAGRTPSLNGKPLPASLVNDDMVRIVSAGGSNYRMEIQMTGTRLDVEDENGNVLFFNMNELLEASQ